MDNDFIKTIISGLKKEQESDVSSVAHYRSEMTHRINKIENRKKVISLLEKEFIENKQEQA